MVRTLAKLSRLRTPTMAKKKTRERTERRFVPRTTASPLLVYAIGAVGAVLLGAGVWGQFGSTLRKIEMEPFEYAPWLLAAGAVLAGIAIWIGTSTEAAVRVGVAGIAEERGQTRRMPWWRVEDVSGDVTMIVVRGKDSAGVDMSVRFSRRAMPTALPWVVREARDRAEDRLELSDEVIAAIGKPAKEAGSHALSAASGRRTALRRERHRHLVRARRPRVPAL